MEVSVFEIRVIRLSGESELHYSDAGVRVGGRLKIDGMRLAVLKRMRAARPGVEAAYICLEIPAPDLRALRQAA